jgi:hypothetical protein
MGFDKGSWAATLRKERTLRKNLSEIDRYKFKRKGTRKWKRSFAKQFSKT